MKCFNHPTVDAVGLCKSCSRALCRDCIGEVGKSCSCKDRCEADVASINDLLERGRTAYQKSSRNTFRSGLFTLLLGLAFLLIGLASPMASGPNYFLLIMGLLFTGWGISFFVFARNLKQK